MQVRAGKYVDDKIFIIYSKTNNPGGKTIVQLIKEPYLHT